MHLDTVCTMVDVDKIVMYPNVADTLPAYAVTLADGAGRRRATWCSTVADAEPFLVAAAKAMGIDTLHQIDTGLDPVTAEREQWDDGNNTLALAPRVAVAYERNDETNARLEEAGIEVVRIAGSELGSGRGGPRCMSLPGHPRVRSAPTEPATRVARREMKRARPLPTGDTTTTGRCESTWPGRRGHNSHAGRFATIHLGQQPLRSADRTCRLARPVRAERSSAVSGEPSASASAELGREPLAPAPPAPRRRCRPAGPRPGASRPCARNMPTQPGVRRRARRVPAACSRASASSSASSGSGITQRRCSLVPDVGPVRRLDRRQPGGRDGGGVGLLERGGHGGVRRSVDVGDPEVEAVVHGDVEARRRSTRSCSRGPAPGRVGEPDDAGARRSSALRQHRAEVAGRVAEVVLHLQPEPDLAAVAHHRRRRHRQQRSRACTVAVGGRP